MSVRIVVERETAGRASLRPAGEVKLFFVGVRVPREELPPLHVAAENGVIERCADAALDIRVPVLPGSSEHRERFKAASSLRVRREVRHGDELPTARVNSPLVDRDAE